MALYDDAAVLPPDARDDDAYVRERFVPMDPTVRALVEAGMLPRATYVLADGTPMVPPGHADMLADAGGDPGRVEAVFTERFLAAGGAPGDVAGELAAWLSGQYGACLHDPSPENLVAKDALMRAIVALRSRPRPEAAAWRAALRAAVDALDALELPFAAHDAARFGGPSSRARLIEASRRDYPALWA